MRGVIDDPFDEFMRDNVTLIKQDGRRFDNIKASVQSGKVFTHATQLPFEDGDTITRDLPNGLTERYTILDAHFYPGLDEIPPSYQMKVRRETAIPNERFGVTHQYNVSGNNPRVNVGSTDNSINTVNTVDTSMFADLRKVVLQIPDETERATIIQSVDELEQAAKSGGYMEKYQNFIHKAANHMTLITPFVPALTQMLTGHPPH